VTRFRIATNRIIVGIEVGHRFFRCFAERSEEFLPRRSKRKGTKGLVNTVSDSKAPPRRPEANPQRLLRRFKWLSAASAALIMLLIGASLWLIIRQHLIEEAKQNSVAVAGAVFEREQMKLLDTMPNGSYTVKLSDADLADLDQRMRTFLKAFGIIKVKVYDTSRKIVYSTDGTIIGKIDDSNARLDRVLRDGVIDSELVHKESIPDLQGQERFNADVVETYTPIRVGNSIAGSFEVYVDVTPAYAQIVTAVQYSTAVLLMVLVIVFGALYYLMRQGTMQLAHVQNRLRDLAATDVLTGLYNRRHLFARIEQEFSRMERATLRREPVDSIGFIMADIDHFKAINDTYGHLAGDQILQEVAKRLKGTLRPYDVIGRFGGEEFLVMLPHSAMADAEAVAERLRQIISQAPYDVGGKAIAVTASFGVAHCQDAKDDVNAAVGRADKALYLAKEGGRNKVVLSG
jgi:diguanylate cyclase (GGDEF)-like protein